MLPKNQPIAVVDFDGTLVEFAFPKIGRVRPGAKEFLLSLHNDGWFIIISSCRNNIELNEGDWKYYHEMERFLHEDGFVFDWIDDGRVGKVVGDVYFDDRNAPFKDFEGMLNFARKRFKNGRNGNGQPKIDFLKIKRGLFPIQGSIQIGYLEVILMPNGEIMNAGESVGWFAKKGRYLYGEVNEVVEEEKENQEN